MTTIIIISLLLLASLLPHLTFTAHVGIVNGTEAKPHSRPYMVSIQENKKHVCGGFLISDQFVLTAAHCQMKNEILTAVVGAHDLEKVKRSGNVKVKSYYKHDNYTRRPLRNDIMILKLEKKIKQKYVKAISIPAQEEAIKPDLVCSVAGWGKLSTKGKLSTRLMEANVKIKNNKICEEKWKKSYSAQDMICVYGRGGSCEGDSGGPLVCGNTAVGVTSFGSQNVCNSLDKPEVYAKISAYLPWIHSIMAKAG